MWRIDVYHHLDPAVNEVLGRLTKIDQKLDLNIKNQGVIMSLIDDIQAKQAIAQASIQKNTDLDDSIIASLAAETQQIKDLKAALDAAIAANDPTKLQAVSDAMDAIIAASDAEAQKKTDAITANTSTAPAAPAPDATA